ncbi:GspE/PulE family protein [Roseiconus lacunae]|uniref:ATPase, T2SS/T4P/T4SS family n=1 Tax=Roseiconus lacunae TaxID=2605694 RepID=A0ABT7PN30_9BACT|nr:ATPase, T2SS/T4P/T4SS family [Roseiconus lacunae]MCD0463384.1 Flp pilus assembly complex ATPase component TadA [Roseiconus lacunae]MDM4017738.1 ATPase, T2SS/T4P/T4SS family [Roseiconus lacunae]WRQ48508.1 ATPase, T2SS/T4P/T4SS family [Stieleria sp. HD01]
MKDESTIEFQEVQGGGGDTELTPPELFAANLIEWALERHVSDLFVSDVDGAVIITVRRLGKIEPVRRFASTYGHRLQGHLRVLAGADAGESVRPTEGRGVITTPDGSTAHLRLSSVPTIFGQDVAIRLFDPTRGRRRIDQLGMDQTDVDAIESLVRRKSGLILVTGPVASGKSSTLYAMLDYLNDGSKKIHTIEDPVEHPISGVMQSQVNTRARMDFADLLTAVLRHSPDVIMIGEVRDSQTARAAIRAGASGQLVLATVHSKSAAEAIEMMLQYETDHKFLSSSLSGVINQRLIRRLCTECRKVVDVEDEIEVPDRLRSRMDGHKPVLYRSQKCGGCHEGGYDNLISLPEIMLVDAQIEDAISNRATAMEIESISIQNGMLKLPEVALSYVLRGLTSIEEVNQVLNDPILASLARKWSRSDTIAESGSK